ncbi:MAG TPA: hypothetical protein VN643_07615 [Pyrinomonadaceae bacterium]|nr:hypothetical protein [Pyrinomonadaceae bacterium]
MTPWKTVRVFISSTFHDMRPERDYLVHDVFVELKERGAARRLHLIEDEHFDLICMIRTHTK